MPSWDEPRWLRICNNTSNSFPARYIVSMWVAVVSECLTAASLFALCAHFMRKSKDARETRWKQTRPTVALVILFSSSCALCGLTHALNAARTIYPGDTVIKDMYIATVVICALVAVITAGVCFAGVCFAGVAVKDASRAETNAEENAKHAKHCMLETVETIQDSILVLSSDLRVVRENAATKDLFGSLSLIGKRAISFIHPADVHRFELAAQFVVASCTGLPKVIEYRIMPTARIKAPTSTPFTKSWKSSKVHNGDGLVDHGSQNSRTSNSLSLQSSTSVLFVESVLLRPEFVRVESTILKRMFTDKDGCIQITLEMVTRSVDDRERTQENEAILQQTEEQGRVNAAKLRYISCIAHDLKTPLQSFCYTLDLLLQTQLRSDQRELIQQANVAVDLMKLTISQTMDISKALTGAQLMPRRTAVCISSVLSRVEIIIAGFGKEVPVSIVISPTIIDEIITDEEWLWQMLLNLLTNACKYTDKGSITVRVSLSDPSSQESSENSLSFLYNVRHFTAELHATPAMLLFEVIDTGVGVRDSSLSTMFDAFAQVQEGQVTGTGLGLYGVRMRAEGLQGTCGARHNTESCTGTGTVIWFAIPYVPDRRRSDSGADFGLDSSHSYASASTIREAASPRSCVLSPDELVRRAQAILSSRPLTAMVVEDTLTVRKLMERMLLQMGFAKVVGYENGSKGLDAMMAEPVDIVFSDVQMPIMTGPEMISRFRKFEKIALTTGARVKRQVVVAVTANGSEMRYIAGLGFDDVYPKPLGRNDIYKIVEQFL